MFEFLQNKELLVLIFNMGASFIFALTLLWILSKLIPVLNDLSTTVNGMRISMERFEQILLSFITKIDSELKIKKRRNK